ncbi:MAG: 7-carboxy-7-deazaguanine synthase QueE [Candidatus Omnitrophica bacterium]|nr:7-carboxy-7-deazaguanine synthase QueE [Candidatus Omnitrophota bacterium]
MEARITEVFLSIQGEGIYVGQPQIFIRFAKCNLDCDFCDTTKKGGKRYSVFELLHLINEINSQHTINTISITGGEPLLHIDFLKSLLPQLKKRNFKVYLETNGTLPDGLHKILNFVDIIAMDMKLPSSQKGKGFWTRHRDFLNLAKRKKVFVKIVVTNKTTPEEIKKTVAIIDDVDPNIPFVLQPVTPANRIKKKVPLGTLFAFQRLAKSVLNEVSIIPQVHKILGAR